MSMAKEEKMIIESESVLNISRSDMAMTLDKDGSDVSKHPTKVCINGYYTYELSLTKDIGNINFYGRMFGPVWNRAPITKKEDMTNVEYADMMRRVKYYTFGNEDVDSDDVLSIYKISHRYYTEECDGMFVLIEDNGDEEDRETSAVVICKGTNTVGNISIDGLKCSGWTFRINEDGDVVASFKHTGEEVILDEI